MFIFLFLHLYTPCVWTFAHSFIHLTSKSAVFAARKKYKVKDADLLGCFYFYILDQIRSFITRFHKLNLAFHLRGEDCRDLAATLRKATAPPPQPGQPSQPGQPGQQNYDSLKHLPLQYDRIYVTDVVDDRFVGFERIIRDWGPRLNSENPHATLLTCSKSWAQSGGTPTDDRGYEKQLIKEMKLKNRVR